MSGTARSAKRTGGRATGPRQARGASTRAGGRGIDLQSSDGAVVLIFWGILATIGVGILAGPAQAWTSATWHRAVQWVTHDVRDPALEDIPVRAEVSGKGYSPAAFGRRASSPVLAEAWRSGAATWAPAERRAFAVDPQVLQLERTPAGERCTHAGLVVAMKYRHLLAVDPREHAALVADLASC